MTRPDPGRGGRRPSRLPAAAGVLGLAAVIAAALAFAPSWDAPEKVSGERRLAEARAALGRGEYARAEEAASRVERGVAAWAESRLVAGEAATRAGRIAAAADYYGSVPRDGSDVAVRAAFYFGEVCRELGRLTDADQAYAYVLDHRPDDARAHLRRAFLLGVTGRRWESLPHFMFLARTGAAGLNELVLLADLERPIEEPNFLRMCAERNPDDVLVRLGLAAQAVTDGDADEARRRLEEVVVRRPDLVPAQAMLGELSVDADDEMFSAWHASLPAAADRHPDVWYVRGLRARRQGDLRVAARCFWQAVRLAPEHRRGNYQLGQVLVALGETSGGEFAERAGRLYELTHVLDTVLRSEGRHEPSVKRATEILEQAGRAWEAAAWANAAAGAFPQSAWPHATLARVMPLLKDGVPRTLGPANLALRHDLSAFPDHVALLGRSGNGGIDGASSPSASAAVRFVEEGDVGLDFVYLNGADPATKGARMFEQTGGGVAVLDFELDGWPDLYFTQGGEWPTGAGEPTPTPAAADRLYRNEAGRSFADVTPRTGLGDMGFGQGCAVGDFDGDGFPDLYVANVGRNRLYRNNGDGTFADVTEGSGLDASEWTSSCVVVDLNADGLSDLFDVTYLTDPDIYTAICEGRACSPKNFEGVPDRLYVNRGDGTFAFVPDATPARDSKGLGAVAADLGVRGRPSLFIANDQVPNFLLRNIPSDVPHGVVLEEQGFVTGLAFNENGLAMAGMGIASGDADGDGRLDFFVTNFKDESNTLYLQDADDLFVDATNAAGLRGPTLPFVGWGTQFLDADLDGAPDLVVANGHVDDYRDEGGAYHMRPQFFRNAGRGRFVEPPPGEAGEYFAREYLGRGLARLDWNRDGLPDFVVSNVGRRASLVTNRTAGAGRFLNLRLHATKTARDAIGAVAEVVADGRRRTAQLVAGDGYMASNERVLQFGLGDATSVTELRVNWPSGETTTVRTPPLDATIELTEGASFATVRRGSDLESLRIEGEVQAASVR